LAASKQEKHHHIDHTLTIGSGASSCAHITQGTEVLRETAVDAAHFTYNSPPIP